MEQRFQEIEAIKVIDSWDRANLLASQGIFKHNSN